MVEIVTRDNRELYTDLLDDMYRMRYEVAVNQMGWKIPDIQPGYDKDAFDTDETVYLLETSDDRSSVLGCTRLNPTTSPHLMSEVFAGSCDLQPVPRAPSIWECSRFLIDRKRCETKRRNTLARQHLGIAMSEYCIANGITHISWLTYDIFYNNILGVYDTEPLGLPKLHEEDQATYIPALSAVNREGLARQREKLIEPREHIAFYFSPIRLPDGPGQLPKVA